MQHQKCECESPGPFFSGIPGILAAVNNGQLVPGAVAERCDQCERYPSDDAALKHLIALGIASSEVTDKEIYSVHCYAVVRIELTGISAKSPREAAIAANAQFDWDTKKRHAEFADEVIEFLVDVEGDTDFTRSIRFNADFEPIESSSSFDDTD